MNPKARTSAVLWGGLLFMASCQWLGGYEDFSAGGGHPCDALDETKLDPRGAALTRVNVPGGTCVWIDRDEVTVKQYSAWLADPAAFVEGWDADFCAWKSEASNPLVETHHACSAKVLAEELQPFHNDKPIRCVDWCDAEAFCRWSGKRLCHDFIMGTQVPRAKPREWYYACTNGDTTVYPWGIDAEDGISNVGQVPGSLIVAERGPFPVGFSPSSPSEFGARNLIGNVAEWAYGCNITAPEDRGKVTPCLTRGGAYYEPMRTCIQDGTRSNDTRDPGIGFRCCADLSVQESIEVSAKGQTPP